ncbi:predicted protein [Sparassis crispa]|uniref:Uncharacterized protein n=1 Tax=Sparassis crispa TaxID=139825 RepID=A0A401H546_9APHY|nr:predicted protein [Sparassis crispa]GBE89557.1 predicted protein [Sparassis crispa]
MLIPFIIALVLPVCVLTTQHALSVPGPVDNSTAPFIFNSLASLLAQWPNTYHANGHTIITGVLEPFTLLYHARKDANLPPSPEWFAFDAEMSYGIMAGRGGQTYMLTYRNIRPMKIVYFDGMSASLSGTGWLDTQEVLIAGKGQNGEPDSIVWWDEYTRADKLCKWAIPRGVEGIVRMNAGFEVLWCDFNSPAIQLVSHLNITPPGTPPSTPWVPPAPAPGPGPDRPGREPGTGRGGPGSDRRRPGGPWGQLPPLSLSASNEWLRAANHRSVFPQPHVSLDYSTFVTFYHPRLHSLVPSRVGQHMRQHRIWPNVSEADAHSVIHELDEVLRRPGWRNGWPFGTGMDWAALARDIVEEWADRIDQLHEFLGNTTAEMDGGHWQTSNTTQALATVRRLAYSPLNPYMDTGSAPNVSAWTLFFEMKLSPSSLLFPHRPLPYRVNTTALQRCTYSSTGFLHYNPHLRMTSQEELLLISIETIQERLCTDFGTLFVESMGADDKLELEEAQVFLQNWETRIAALMDWLDWTEWMRCEEVCPRDSVCTMPLWPVVRWGNWPRGNSTNEDDPSSWKPQCVSLVPMERWPGPGRRDTWDDLYR